MRLKLILITAASIYSLLMTQFIAADTLTVVVNNVSVSEGSIMLAVMSGEDEFNGKQPAIASVIQRAQTGAIEFSTSNLPSGEYAIRVMHDINGNGDLDSNFVGMPTEPWAMSNNAKGNFGPPKWDDVKFMLDGPTTQTLDLSK
jgi:uncharacterized protein (DUF2141 family)